MFDYPVTLTRDEDTVLVAPADIGLGRLEVVLFDLPLAQFQLVQARLELRHRLGAIAVLRALALALHHEAAGQMGSADGRIGLVDVLVAGARRAEGVDAQIARVDVDRDGIIDFGVDEHARERGVAPAGGIEGRLAHQAVDPGSRCAGIRRGSRRQP